MVKGIGALVLCCLVAMVFGMSVANAASGVVISEIQTTGCREYQINNPALCAVDNGAGEFVELTNASSTDVDVSGWRIEYLSASHTGVGAPTRILAALQGRLMAHSSMLASFEGYIQNADVYFGTASSSGYLAKSGGHVRVVTASSEVIDHVSWGSAQQFTGWPKVVEISAGSAASRLLPGDPLYSPTSPFIIAKITTPTAGGLLMSTCDGVALSEILPNPAGGDAGNEFVELFNPTNEPIELSGCKVRLNEGEEYAFSSGAIMPGGYFSVSDAILGFSLPNSAGGVVWLISSSSEQGVEYPANMGDDEVWIFLDNAWKLSTTATKSAANKLTTAIVGGKGGGSRTSSLLPCPAGKYRNPATHRCRSIASAVSATVTPCKPGQTRNPATNRCRSATLTAASLTPCKSGQTRNPETNRCRSATLTSAVLRPCKPGQERNPDTNRCRKVTASGAGADYKVEKTPPVPGAPIGWLVAGTAGASALGYGAFEWRREIGNFLGRVKDKITGGSSP